MNMPTPQPSTHVTEPAPEERYRPSFHFAPQRNWMNDPNGLVYYAGEYHLFYQYNPQGDQWGHMSWGHAVSHDLVSWDELPVAIPEADGEMIFSGCVVVDWGNVSGLGDGSEPPLIAIYTGFNPATEIQRQCLAYSHDRGRTFTHYAGNPLIDLGLAHFRDPKVFYHEPSSSWIMIVALSREHRVLFYRSANLLDWTPAGSFGPAGGTNGQWECPDLMLVPLETHPSRSRWVLKVDVDAAFIGGGSGAQYFVGDFDGFDFRIDTSAAAADGDIVDFGPDFYAAVTWSDLPAEQPGPLWVGWMSNHQTGRFYPTQPWRGAQSLPRTLFLFDEGGRLKLGQRPLTAAAGVFGRLAASGADGGAFHARFALNVAGGRSETLRLMAGDDILVSLGYDSARGLIFTREPYGSIEVFFAFETTYPYPAGDEIAVELFFDSCLLDVFVDGGRRVFSCCVFPDEPRLVSVEIDPGCGTTASPE